MWIENVEKVKIIPHINSVGAVCMSIKWLYNTTFVFFNLVACRNAQTLFALSVSSAIALMMKLVELLLTALANRNLFHILIHKWHTHTLDLTAPSCLPYPHHRHTATHLQHIFPLQSKWFCYILINIM